jgi:endonuclease/exonuclease/phosphatase (EEP) superfamily protein YafD
MRHLRSNFGFAAPSQRFVRMPEVVLVGQCRSTLPHLPSRIKLLSWNIAKLTDRGHWQQEFTDLVQAHQPDLIFLQEAWVCAQTQHLFSLTEIPWQFAPNFLDAYHQHYAGVLTATHVHCLSRRSQLSLHCEPITQTPKVALLAEFPLRDRQHSLLTVNAHLINFVNLARFRAELAQLEALIKPHQGAIIFAGDFNVWHPSRWNLLAATTHRLGLQPVTFAAKEAQKIKRFLNSPPLDYIFYRGCQALPLSAKVIETARSSDHKPLIVELAVE